ncbi:hypothetical protein MKX01_021997 [Papaver californicum]|nr:hypothetical protein MKX01_021997 [Papaver californicum]
MRRSGKVEIKYIENSTSRQVTYSKRKSGILKKARELTILCNAQVCLIMFSNTGKHYEYVSPSTTMKNFLDRYQRETKINLWEAQYEDYVMTSQIQTTKKHVRCLEEARKRLLRSVYAQKQEQEFFNAVPANNEQDQQPDYGSATTSMARPAIDGGGGNCESSKMTFQQLQPSHTNLYDEAGGALIQSILCSSTLSTIK